MSDENKQVTDLTAEDIDRANHDFSQSAGPTTKEDRGKQRGQSFMLWRGFVTDFVERIPNWRLWYAVAFAIVSIVGNCTPAFFPSVSNAKHISAGMMIFGIVALFYILMALAAIPILWPTFQKAMRSNQSTTRVSVEMRGSLPSGFVGRYKTVRVLLLYIFVPLIFLGINSAYAQVTSAMIPNFAQSQHLHVGNNVWMDLGMACLASLEELWRWSMILSVLLIARAIKKSGWLSNSAYRRNALIVAILVSSFFFGLGHAAEFTQYKILAIFILGGSGVILAGAAIVSRRLWVAIVVHAVYDFFALTNLGDAYSVYIYALALLGLIVVYPAFWKLFTRLQANTPTYTSVSNATVEQN